MDLDNKHGNGTAQVMIVEDSPTQAEQLKMILERSGYLCSTARNGREALDSIRSGQSPSLVISDIVMPEMDGYVLCRSIKDDIALRSIPVILLTSLTDPVDVMKGLECGADNFIFKPYDERYLLDRVAFMQANWRLRKAKPAQIRGIEIIFSDQKYFITSDRMQILNLLLSTYEAAIEKNRKLVSTTAELEARNAQLAAEIAERKRAEELATAAQKEAERANNAKSDFMSHMSHELRTPLNAIIGFAQLLQMKSSDPRTLESADQIFKGGKHLLALINEVLDLARVEAGRLSVSIEPVPLARVITEAIELVKPIADVRNVSISLVTGCDDRVFVKADRQRLIQVMLNLLTNAAKYNRPNGTIEVRCTEIEDRRQVEVIDTGRGISENDLEKLFRPFERLGNQTEEGTGIGLVLSRKLMELQGGDLLLLRTSDAGSCFALQLPAAQALDQIVGPFENVQSLATEVSGDPFRIVYVEDNASNITLMERFLEGSGMELVSATTAASGLELITKNPPDLVFLDLHLPDAHGEQVLKSLLTDPKVSHVPVVILSADATPGQRQNLIRAGATSYLTKPIDLGELRKTVNDIRQSKSID